ncbi:MAG: hypothetical protein HC820_00020 [Hydrococcus sp. RM1_1_31]|nr:hypothetical protein [Hydrococcus sp. RM1_1_31]
MSEPASYENQQPLEDSQPTLAQLQALLLACQSLSELKNLKQKHTEKVCEAYRALPTEQQLIIDGIAATTVNHQVFKYVGKLLEKDGQRLTPGALVLSRST